MRPTFTPRLIHQDPFDDPGLFVSFSFEKRALFFDLPDLSPLSSRDIQKATHVFVSHTHMDHFIGFDHLLRLLVGREKEICLYGPQGFLNNLEGKLSGYAWNLAKSFQNRLTIKACEVHEKQVRQREYLLQNGFASPGESFTEFDGVLLKEANLRVRAAVLDHGIPCLGFRLSEQGHVNVLGRRLEEMGLLTGSWLARFKRDLFDPSKKNRRVEAPMADGTTGMFNREELAEKITRITPGQKIAYITDAACTPANRAIILDLIQGVDQLFMEASFSHAHEKDALRKNHLTAFQAGELAREAGVKRLAVFHFSPRYLENPQLLEKEAMAAFESNNPA